MVYYSPLQDCTRKNLIRDTDAMALLNSSLSISGKWQGQYSYGYSKQLRDFSFELNETGPGDYAGRMFDDKELPSGNLVGRFKNPILNLSRESSTRSWLKVYEPTAFRGEISDDGRSLSGVWTNSASTGSWRAERVGAAAGDDEIDRSENDFAKVAGVSEEPPFQPEAENPPPDMSDGNPAAIDWPMPMLLRQAAVAPVLPSLFNSGRDQSIAPSISVDTISSDSVKSLNIDDRSSNTNSFLSNPAFSFPSADPAPTSTVSQDVLPSKALQSSTGEICCSRCGAPKGDFGFCLKCGHSFGLSQ
jgi:hypothetical protein